VTTYLVFSVFTCRTVLLLATTASKMTLRYKPEGHGFDSLWCHWNFSLT